MLHVHQLLHRFHIFCAVQCVTKRRSSGQAYTSRSYAVGYSRVYSVATTSALLKYEHVFYDSSRVSTSLALGEGSQNQRSVARQVGGSGPQR